MSYEIVNYSAEKFVNDNSKNNRKQNEKEEEEKEKPNKNEMAPAEKCGCMLL